MTLASSPWVRAARAVASGDLVGGAEILEQTGARTYAAFYRLHAGTEDGVRRALEFYRSVGATHFVREGETMLAASA